MLKMLLTTGPGVINEKIYSQTCLKGSPKGRTKNGCLRQVHLQSIFIQRTQKRWLFKTGGPLIEVATYEGLTVLHPNPVFI